MSNLDLVKAALKNKIDKRVIYKPNVLVAEARGTASKQAFEAVTGDLRGLDLDYLDSLNRIEGTLKNTYMESISANKITSGSILGTNLTLAGTEASSNKTTLTMIGDALLRVNDGTSDRIKMSNSGLQFLSSGSFSSAADVGNNSKITSMPGGSDNRIFSSFGFALAESSFLRGALLIAHGVGGTGIDGLVRIAATTAHGSSLTDAASAYIDVKSRGGVAGGRGQVSVQADLYAFQQFYALQYAEFRGNANMKGSLDVDLNTVLRSALTVQGATILQAALNVSGLTTLGGVDAVNVRVSGQYNNTGATATFGGPIAGLGSIAAGSGITAQGSVLANGGNLVGDGLNVRSGSVAMPNYSIKANMLGDSSATLRVIHNNLFNPAQDSVGLRTISPLLGGTSLQSSSGNHSHASGETSSFEVLPVPDRRRSLAQRLTIRRRIRDFGPVSGEVSAEDYNNLLGYVQLIASQLQTLSHLLQDAPDRDAFEREDMFRRGEITDENIFFEFRHGHREDEGKHIALLPHKWTESAHPDLAV